jgi:peroxiredoxin family protein
MQKFFSLKKGFLKMAQLNLFGKYAVTKKLSIVLKESQPDSQTMISYVYSSTYKAGGAAVGNFVAKNTFDIFHVQTREAKSSPNFSQGEGV